MATELFMTFTFNHNKAHQNMLFINKSRQIKTRKTRNKP